MQDILHWTRANLRSIEPDRKEKPIKGSLYDPQSFAATKRTIEHIYRVGCKCSLVFFKNGDFTVKRIDAGTVTDPAISAQLVQKGLDPSKKRVLQCIVKDYEIPKDPIPPEYIPLIKAASSHDLVDGIRVFVLTDMPLLRADGCHPWPMVYETNAERKVQISQIPSSRARYLPVYNSFTMEGYLDIAIPTYDDLSASYSMKKHGRRHDVGHWNDRKPIGFFRGSSTGCGRTVATNPRLALATMAKQDKIDGLNAGLTAIGKSPRFDREIGLGWIDTSLSKVPFVPPRTAQTFKYTIHVEGNVAAFRLADMMRAGCLQLIVEGPYRLWYEPLLIVGRPLESTADIDKWHYIRIRRDLSDLDATLKWCRSHDRECREIAERGCNLAWTFGTWKSIVGHTKNVLQNQ